jgi:hypothetical protein
MFRCLFVIGLASLFIVTTSAPSQATLTTYTFTGGFSGSVTLDILGDGVTGKTATSLSISDGTVTSTSHSLFSWNDLSGSLGPSFNSFTQLSPRLIVAVGIGSPNLFNDPNFSLRTLPVPQPPPAVVLAVLGGVSIVEATTTVPEPSQSALLGLGLVGFFAMRRRQKLRRA